MRKEGEGLVFGSDLVRVRGAGPGPGCGPGLSELGWAVWIWAGVGDEFLGQVRVGSVGRGLDFGLG